jgi:hypothetical protein
MNEEWLVYRRPEEYARGKKLDLLVAMDAENYDKWAERINPYQRDIFPVVARGLTQEVAKKMIELTKEPK